MASRLGVTVRDEPRDIEVEAAPLERIAADLLQVNINRRSRLHGVEVGELRLPVGASVSLLVRDGHTLVPDQRTVLRRGDDMLVVTPRKCREETEQRLRSVSRRGRLADWLGEQQTLTGSTRRRCSALGSGTQTDDDCLATITRRALDSLSKPLPTTTSMPGPRSVVETTTLVLRPNWRATSRAAMSFASVVNTRTRFGSQVRRRVAHVPLGEAHAHGAWPSCCPRARPGCRR